MKENLLTIEESKGITNNSNYKPFSQLINQSRGAYAGGRVASSTLSCHPLGFVRASLHEGPLPIPRTPLMITTNFSNKSFNKQKQTVM